MTEEGLMPDPVVLREAMPFVNERMDTLRDAPRLLRFLFTADPTLNEKAQRLVAEAPEGHLAMVAEALDGVDPWEAKPIFDAIDDLATRQELKRKKAFEPVRAAVTGSDV